MWVIGGVLGELMMSIVVGYLLWLLLCYYVWVIVYFVWKVVMFWFDYILFGFCLFVIVFDVMGFGFVYLMMLVIFSDLYVGILLVDVGVYVCNFYFGFGYGIYLLCMFFGLLLMGELFDCYGCCWILLLCVFGFVVGYVMMVVGVWWVSIVLLLVGCGFMGLMVGC